MPEEPERPRPRPRPRPGCVEDYDSDASEAVPNTRKSANVTARRTSPTSARSKPDRSARLGPPDAASDSGYSSHTQATAASLGSINNAQQSKPAPTPAPAPHADPPASPIKRRPTLTHARQNSRQQSPDKASTRSKSSSRKPTNGYPEERECTKPGCTCRTRQRESFSRPSPLEAPYERSAYPPYAPQSRNQPQYSQPPPISPRGLQRSAYPLDPYPLDQGSYLATSQPRARPPLGTRRPMSYHGGGSRGLEDYYYSNPFNQPMPQYGMPPQPPPMLPGYGDVYDLQRAYDSRQYPALAPPNYGGNPLSPVAASPSSPTMTRPMLTHSRTEQPSARRSNGPPPRPLVTHGLGPALPVPYETVSAGPSARRSGKTATMPGSFDGSALYSSDEEYERPSRRDLDYARMPPPKDLPRRPRPQSYISGPVGGDDRLSPPDSRERRSSRGSRSRSRTDAGYSYKEYRYERPAIHNDTERTVRVERRQSSSRRPSLGTDASGRSKATSYSNSSGNAKVITAESRSGRRQSYMGHERRSELENRRNAEAYMDAVRGEPLPEIPTEAVRKASLRSKAPSISSGSHRSHRSHQSIDGSRASRNADGEFKIRMNAGTTVDILGDMDGRKISLRPDRSGQTELVIGASSGKEKRYVDEAPRSGAGSRTARSRQGSESRGRRDSRVRSTVYEFD